MSLKTRWQISLSLASLALIILQIQGSILSERVKGGILSLEFAWSSEKLNDLLSKWDYSDVMINIIFDLFFIPAYTYFFYTSVQLAQSALANNANILRIGKYVIPLCFLPFIFDYLENAIMLMSVSGYYSEFSIQFTYLLAMLKFISIALIFSYLMVCLILFGFLKMKAKL